ncbi:hypothetical protein GDO81_011149 [Engystomops pustulosus]|uniref:Uncharacterized protein n=1 Tax=Engystomops pustulosus TaxID=76066 RepID=A0AAV7BC96_ENGPU|nr:hypothetical protein GDO81_011149 [Engystomops pustulosus]
MVIHMVHLLLVHNNFLFYHKVCIAKIINLYLNMYGLLSLESIRYCELLCKWNKVAARCMNGFFFHTICFEVVYSIFLIVLVYKNIEIAYVISYHRNKYPLKLSVKVLLKISPPFLCLRTWYRFILGHLYTFVISVQQYPISLYQE